MKASITPLLRGKLEVVHTRKPDHYVEAVFCDKIAGRIALTDVEWKWIINEVYDPLDSKRVRKLIEMSEIQPPGLKYDALVQILLSYQLAKRQTFVRPIAFDSV